jgi:hypothetical protein
VSTRTSVSGLVCAEIDCEVSFGPCSKVRIEGRGLSCEVSNAPRIALCLFEITGGGACRSPLVPSNAEIRYCLIKPVTLGGILVTVYAAITPSHDSSKKC